MKIFSMMDVLSLNVVIIQALIYLLKNFLCNHYPYDSGRRMNPCSKIIKNAKNKKFLKMSLGLLDDNSAHLYKNESLKIIP